MASLGENIRAFLFGVTEKKEAPADAEEWEGKPNKLALLER